MNKKPFFKFALREDLKNEKQFLPTRGEPFATGYDVRAAQPDKKPLIIKPGDYFKIPLGFRAIPEEGWWFQLHPRSSSFAKKHMHNLIGIIDEHYSHEVLFAGQYLPEIELETDTESNLTYDDEIILKSKTYLIADNLVINWGDAIGQIIPFKRIDMFISEINNVEYDDLCKQRMAIRNGGFGSTDQIK